jgi:hypothetical protein
MRGAKEENREMVQKKAWDKWGQEECGSAASVLSIDWDFGDGVKQRIKCGVGVFLLTG